MIRSSIEDRIDFAWHSLRAANISLWNRQLESLSGFIDNLGYLMFQDLFRILQ